MADNNEAVPRSNLSASVAAMSQRLKEARQQNRLPQSAEKSSISQLGGRSQSPTPPETTDNSSTPISVKAAQADLELKIKELEVTSMTDRIRESESRLTGVSSENTKLRNIIEQLELKLMRVMERNDDDIKERQLQWEEESGKIVQEFALENRNMGEELDATKSVLSLVQEDYRVAGEVVNRLQVELEEEKKAHAETQGTLSQSVAKIVQLKKEKGNVEEELEMTKAQLQMAMSSQGGSTQAEYEKLQLDNLSLQKKYSQLQQEMEANDVDNGIDKYKEKIASLERELDDELQTSTSLRECLKEKDDSIINLRNELESTQVAHDQEISTLRSILTDNSVAGQTTSIPPPLSKQHSNNGSVPLRPIIFLDIDGVLNITKHNKQIQFEPTHLDRLKNIIQKTNAQIVLSTFWRHFHSYITYVFHRHGIDVASCMLPLPMGATRGKQCTKKFLHFHRLKQEEYHDNCSDGTEESMIGRIAEDEAEYASRAEEIEAWLKLYGAKYLGGKNSNGNNSSNTIEGYEWHPEEWKYVILDDRPTAAKPDTPLFSRFVQTETKVGLSEDDEDWAIEILLSGPTDAQNRPLQRKPSLGVRSLDEIFSHKPCSISENLAVLLSPERSPIKAELQSDQPQQETLISADDETSADENNMKSSSHQSYESEILSAMCDYDNICPSLIALMQPPSMDDGDDAYSPARNMVKSFAEEEEKKSTSFEEGGGQHHINKDEKEKECNLLEQSESFDSVVPQSPPPMTMFLRMDTFPDENADDAGDEKDHDIGLDDLGSRWNKRPQLPFGADDDDDDDGSGS